MSCGKTSLASSLRLLLASLRYPPQRPRRYYRSLHRRWLHRRLRHWLRWCRRRVGWVAHSPHRQACISVPLDKKHGIGLWKHSRLKRAVSDRSVMTTLGFRVRRRRQCRVPCSWGTGELLLSGRGRTLCYLMVGVIIAIDGLVSAMIDGYLLVVDGNLLKCFGELIW
jgi:hypothetical protein